MDSSSTWKKVWRRLNWVDKTFVFIFAAWQLSGLLGAGGAARLLLLLLVLATGFLVAIRWLRIGVKQAIWSLRNRLYVAYVFIAVVPILLIGIFLASCTWALAGQIALYLVRSEFDRRLTALTRSAETMVRVPPFQRESAWQRVRITLDDAFPVVDPVIEDRGRIRFPEKPAFEPPKGWGEVAGIVVRDGLLYAWARAISGETEVTLLAPLTKKFLVSLAPGLGDVTILEFASGTSPSGREIYEMRPHDRMPGEDPFTGSVLPPAVNRFDFDFKQGASLPVSIWESPPDAAGALPGPPDETEGLLSIHSRASAVLLTIFGEQTISGTILVALYVTAVVFLLVELVSLFIGASLTRTITGAFAALYDGTERVREGDFSHRIAVRGTDQLAAVSDSFNRMTENLERLLAVAKEKERIQAELEIAQAVQRQLYPKSVPALPKLELKAVCNPARMVSGDYYDYQALQGQTAVIAVGDVAGKGISAALLMATLQSSLRTHVRSSLSGDDGEGALSTSRLVSQLNEQVYADTSPEKYATFYFSIYDDETGLLTYTNAGHLPPILFRRGESSMLDVNGMVVGAFPFAQYTESQVRLESGDLLLAYTDGITEPENEYGEMFGEQRVIDVVSRHADRDTDHIVKAVMGAVMEWTGSPELQDDMTILVARRH